MLGDAQGSLLAVGNEVRDVRLSVYDGPSAHATHRVGSVQRPLWSVGNGMENGLQFNLGETGGWVERGRRCVMLEVLDSSPWLRATPRSVLKAHNSSMAGSLPAGEICFKNASCDLLRFCDLFCGVAAVDRTFFLCSKM